MQTEIELLDKAAELIERANANLQPELVASDYARKLMKAYARIEKLGGFGLAALSRKLDDADEVARVAGTSVGKAKAVVTTGKMLQSSDDLNGALAKGEVSLDQATEIAATEQSAPGTARDLVAVAKEASFHVLKDKARTARLEAEQHKGLAARQHDARRARSYTDDLGMVAIHLLLEPHVGAPIVARAEAEAQRLVRTAKGANNNGSGQGSGDTEPFERYLADSYAELLSGAGKGRAKRPELVVLVSHEVAARGWTKVKDGEVCKIPGVGPLAPETARKIATDAFLTGVFYDGVDLRHAKRWSRHIPPEVAVALELGEPPSFDGICCVDCGNRFRTEFDHVQPRSAKGPTSHPNLKPRCWSCHQAKTKKDMAAARSGPAGRSP